ncbi:LAFA_0D17524g1_1 [Lachancea sp. 'fantastica']|nr:LAFA_0D17524g1_1 [Lachancea sp. 'fantastica']
MLDRGGIPAIVFLVLYGALCSWVSLLLFTKRVSWKSRYTSIFIHTILRLAAQICGIGYAVAGVEHYQWLIAYFVFGAEGYFSLVWCVFRFLIAFQNELLGESWIEPRRQGRTLREYYKVSVRYPVLYFHYSLAAANALIIVGSVQGVNSHSPSQASKQVESGRTLRDVGTALFIAWVGVFALFCVRTYPAVQNRSQKHFLHILSFTVLPLTIRGAFGILATEINQWNYALPDSYDNQGLKPGPLAAEYVLGTFMEWLTCFLLLCTGLLSWFTEKHSVDSVSPENNSSKPDGASRM